MQFKKGKESMHDFKVRKILAKSVPSIVWQPQTSSQIYELLPRGLYQKLLWDLLKNEFYWVTVTALAAKLTKKQISTFIMKCMTYRCHMVFLQCYYHFLFGFFPLALCFLLCSSLRKSPSSLALWPYISVSVSLCYLCCGGLWAFPSQERRKSTVQMVI